MTLRIGPVEARDEAMLAALFATIAADPSAERFHPHPFDAAEAGRRARYAGADLYALLTHDDRAIGYGMLRGFDEGYAVPSLGIFVAAEARGTGAALALMNYLHLAAKLRGAPATRLKVYPDNARAVRLYRSLGYIFEETLQAGQLVGRREA